MKALVFDKELNFVTDYPKPIPQKGEALIRVTYAGICNTDVEITKGYMGFKGICGHEFLGVVEEVNADDKSLIGKRVTGEINLGCGDCPDCLNNMQRHCQNRQTLGILNKDGTFAQYVTLPLENIIAIPDSVPDEDAILIEPLAAALEILEQVHVKPADKIAILGDGKLGLLISLVLSTTQADVVTIGKHENKLAILKAQGIKTKYLNDANETKFYDIVVDATGSVDGFEKAISLVKPRGIFVLKSTVAAQKPLNLAPIVIDEITVVGSRCGQFKPALRLLEKKILNLKPLITKVFEFDKAKEAFAFAQEKGVLKVILKF